MFPRLVAIAGVSALAVVCFCGQVHADKAKTSEVATSGAPMLEIELRNGDIEIVNWSKNAVRAESSGEKAVKLEKSGNTVRIPGKILGGEDVKLWVPAGTRLNARTLSGDIKVTGLGGGVEVRAVAGDVQVTSCKGGVEARSVSGAVRIRGAQGRVEAKSVSGAVVLENVAAKEVEAKSVSGEVLLKNVSATRVEVKSMSGTVNVDATIADGGSLSARSFSGEVVVHIPRGAGFDLRAKSRSGQVQVDPPLQNEEKKRGRVTGRIGNGGRSLRLRSFSGKIHVKAK